MKHHTLKNQLYKQPITTNNKVMRTIQEVRIGEIINSRRNGKGMVTDKTKRTITVTFENGNTVKNTYRYNDAYFYSSDF